MTDGENWFGVGLEPSSKAIIGSQQVPYIYEDRISRDDFLDGMMKLYNMTTEERHKMALEGRKWSQKHFSFDDFVTRWDELFTRLHKEHGSWETRTGYTRYEMRTF